MATSMWLQNYLLLSSCFLVEPSYLIQMISLDRYSLITENVCGRYLVLTRVVSLYDRFRLMYMTVAHIIVEHQLIINR